MEKKLLLGNEAVARGLYEAGVTVVSSYPGTPSTEITEAVTKYDEIYSEWAPVSYTHLDVYKRQPCRRAGPHSQRTGLNPHPFRRVWIRRPAPANLTTARKGTLYNTMKKCILFTLLCACLLYTSRRTGCAL